MTGDDALALLEHPRTPVKLTEWVRIYYYDPTRNSHGFTQILTYNYALVRLDLMRRSNPFWTIYIEDA